jgi:hypothetical protein
VKKKRRKIKEGRAYIDGCGRIVRCEEKEGMWEFGDVHHHCDYTTSLLNHQIKLSNQIETV